MASLFQRARPAEIANLYIKVGVEDYVFGFYIAVNHVAAVDVAQRLRRLEDETQRQMLWQPVLRVDVEEEAAVAGVLEQQVDNVVHLEIVDEVDDVWVL